MTKRFFSLFILTSIAACHLSLFSCNSSDNPNLPKRKLLALLNAITLKTAEPTPPTAGVQKNEIEAVDSYAPPVVIDIAGNLNNKKAFKLSDIASSVRYVILKSPPDIKISFLTTYGDFSYSIASDDTNIFLNTMQGLFCYSAEGQYLYTVVKKDYEGSGDFWTSRVKINDIIGSIDFYNGKLVTQFFESGRGFHLSFYDVKEMNAQMLLNRQSNELRNIGVQPQYKRLLGVATPLGTYGYISYENWRFMRGQHLMIDDNSIFNIDYYNSLATISTKGDTLGKINNYVKSVIDSIRVTHEDGTYINNQSIMYRINGQVMLRKYNDTVFRVTPPNRLTPAYVMNWGKYKSDIREHVAKSDLEGKFVLDNWVETPRFILIHYTEGRDSPIRRDQGKVKDHWAIYNKSAKTLTHHVTSDARALIENDVEPLGMPFWAEGINHKGEMYMVFSKETLKNVIEKGLNRNSRLKTIYDNMKDGEVCIMIVN